MTDNERYINGYKKDIELKRHLIERLTNERSQVLDVLYDIMESATIHYPEGFNFFYHPITKRFRVFFTFQERHDFREEDWVYMLYHRSMKNAYEYLSDKEKYLNEIVDGAISSLQDEIVKIEKRIAELSKE